jgi:hypothetical protein
MLQNVTQSLRLTDRGLFKSAVLSAVITEAIRGGKSLLGGEQVLCRFAQTEKSTNILRQDYRKLYLYTILNCVNIFMLTVYKSI